MEKNKTSLAVEVENPNYSFQERYKMGQELAKIGDVRVETFQPKMIHIEEGSFIMGLDEQQINLALGEYSQIFRQFSYEEVKSWFYKSFPPHEVKVDAFRVSKYLVTNKNFKFFLDDTGSPSVEKLSQPLLSNHPVTNISIGQAREYSLWLSKRTGRTFRLPTEIEWEWIAISCENNFRYPWGNTFSKSLANTSESKLNHTTAVGLFPKGFSIQGVADLAGNVEEWTDSLYKPYPNGTLIKDRLYKFADGKYNILRGGCYSLNGDLCLSRRRHGYFPDYSITGFRIVESLI